MVYPAAGFPILAKRNGAVLAIVNREPTELDAYADLVRRVGRIRGYGDFLHYHLLARGAIDLVVESDLNILDIAPLAVIGPA